MRASTIEVTVAALLAFSGCQPSPVVKQCALPAGGAAWTLAFADGSSKTRQATGCVYDYGDKSGNLYMELDSVTADDDWGGLVLLFAPDAEHAAGGALGLSPWPFALGFDQAVVDGARNGVIPVDTASGWAGEMTPGAAQGIAYESGARGSVNVSGASWPRQSGARGVATFALDALPLGGGVKLTAHFTVATSVIPKPPAVNNNNNNANPTPNNPAPNNNMGPSPTGPLPSGPNPSNPNPGSMLPTGCVAKSVGYTAVVCVGPSCAQIGADCSNGGICSQGGDCCCNGTGLCACMPKGYGCCPVPAGYDPLDSCPPGYGCTDSSGCCMGQGTTVVPANNGPRSNQLEGAPCGGNAECFSNVCSGTCQCGVESSPCKSGASCCATDGSGRKVSCRNDMCQCGGNGWTCVDDTDCCPSLSCSYSAGGTTGNCT